jgi:site-specific DNA-methyltransferase (adenine-specific)
MEINSPTRKEAGGRGGSENHTSRNHHPTVKPVELMRWLCRLVTPPNGLILDPFCGSGSTGVAATLEAFRFVGIEQEAEYVAIARKRITETPPSLFGEVA